MVGPTALGAQCGIVSEKVMPTRAFENGVFICYANSFGQENGMDFFGGSCIVAPDGADLARAGSAAEILSSTVGKIRRRPGSNEFALPCGSIESALEKVGGGVGHGIATDPRHRPHQFPFNHTGLRFNSRQTAGGSR